MNRPVDCFDTEDAKDPWTETRGHLQVVRSLTAMLEIEWRSEALVPVAGQALIII